MGSIGTYETKRGRRFRVHYRRPDKRPTQKRGFTSKREAERFLAIVEVDMMRGGYIYPAASRITVSEWMRIWLDARSDLCATTRSRVEDIVAKHIEPSWGDAAIGRLTRLHLQEWVSRLPGAPSTVRKIVGVLSGALEFAVEDGRLRTNPAHGLKLPKVVNRVRQFLTYDQIAALAWEVSRIRDGRALGYDVAVLALAYCGLRWSELSGLRVRDFDARRRRLIVRQAVVVVRGRLSVEAPKDYKQRSIPVPPFLVERLAIQTRGRGPDDPVLYGMRTKTWLRNHLFRQGWFDPAAAVIGVPGPTPHEMRHTGASLAVSAGANVKALQRILGHASAAVTLDVYADLFDKDLDEVALTLDRHARNAGIGHL